MLDVVVESIGDLLKIRSALPIYIDVDDVLSETGQALCRCVREEFGKAVSFDQIREFDLSVSFDLTPQEFRHLFAVFHQDEILMNLPVLPDAKVTVRRWSESGREIHVVTGRPWHTRDLTLEWLRIHEIPFHQFHIVDKYGRESEDAALTLDQLAARSYAYAVEDSPHMAEFIARRMRTPVFLIRRPWNETVPFNDRIIPVSDWQALGAACEQSGLFGNLAGFY